MLLDKCSMFCRLWLLFSLYSNGLSNSLSFDASEINSITYSMNILGKPILKEKVSAFFSNYISAMSCEAESMKKD